MKKERLEHFRTILNARLEELLSDAGKTVSDMNKPEEDHYADPTDRAAHETDTSFLLRVRDRERKLISKVKDGLKRIDDGSYGICEICGEDISEKRLEARPVTTSCLECKKEEEEQEKKKHA